MELVRERSVLWEAARRGHSKMELTKPRRGEQKVLFPWGRLSMTCLVLRMSGWPLSSCLGLSDVLSEAGWSGVFSPDPFA